MLIEGSVNTNKTDILCEKYLELIKSGEKISDILVLNLNAYKKSEFTEKIKKSITEPQKAKIYTLYGLCYNAFLDNWEYISKLIKAEQTQTPNLCGLEVSQYIFKECIKENNFSDYISKVNLLHQLFRRYSLIVQNDLSKKEVEERSKILNETFYPEAQKAIEDYKAKTIEYKSFDYLRQLSCLSLIYKNTNYFKNIKYIFVDDADEMPYVFWQFIEAIMPDLKDYYIAYDKDGSSRQGFLCAYKSGISDFINKYHPQIIKLEDKSKYANLAKEFAQAVKNGKKLKAQEFNYESDLKRFDMFNKAYSKIISLLSKGTEPKEIAVITPVIDDVLIENFIKNKSKTPFQLLSGNEKLAQDSQIKHLLTILKLINNVSLNDFELKNLLINLLKIPYKKCRIIINEYIKNNKLKDFDFEDEVYDIPYKKLLSLKKSILPSVMNISEQIKIISSNLNIKINDFLIKEAQSFETAFKDVKSNLIKDFIIQIENSIISENSQEIFKIDPSSIIIASPQKITDFSIKTKYQIWLDISHSDWMKQDTGTLYNAWVFNRDYKKTTYSLEDNITLTKERTSALIRKLILCAQEHIYLYSSIYDNNGNENYGAINDYIETVEEKKAEFNITPRDDQKGVLEYKCGKMGVMAVPGAGKTTILLALVIKLLNDNISSENIFVLTYMESAAKNFKERLKNALPQNTNLPNISTIHGLALRIIKENANYAKIGLDEDFEICDDTLKEKIIKELFYKLKIDEDNYENYLKCLSLVKLSCNNITSPHKQIKDFLEFYKEYNIVLKKKNLLDYDDMLYYAVKLLEENQQIRAYYQNLCKYIIEDEAQDSTKIQQKLLELLSGKYNNLVRCGDINQAITSTFTNSDTESFKTFINNNKKVEMNYSQRCSKPIYELANCLIKNNDYKQAFYDIEIKGTQNNPKTTEKPEFLLFDNEKEEKNYILNKVKQIISTNPKSSIALLLRLNTQVNDYNEFFISNGIKTSIRTDCLSQKNIFKLIYSVINITQNPINNKLIAELADNYNQYGICKFYKEDIDFLKTLKEPFINLSFDNLISESLSQLYWDIEYWLNESACSIKNLALKAGLYYAKTDTDKANTYIISTIIKKLITETNSQDVIKQLEYISKKPLSTFKLFEDEQQQDNYGIQIMTVHKSKGDEFDYVFLAQMHEDNFPTQTENIKLKSGTHFYQTIKHLSELTPLQTPEKQKEEQQQETLRLLYVAFTRAKQGLYITSAKSYQRNKKVKLSKFYENLI